MYIKYLRNYFLSVCLMLIVMYAYFKIYTYNIIRTIVLFSIPCEKFFQSIIVFVQNMRIFL